MTAADPQPLRVQLESQCRDLLLAAALVDHKPEWFAAMIAPIRKTLAKLEDVDPKENRR